ncbi:MAG TPA: hydrolase [Cyanobacteria bacterium UBA11149]|nr:hydrolase [Cyanobacteria bacterium UBA11367]HBE59398.1 hydrolase [Cyanobacteria bacterium UBA11366]HBK62309.1 hydrolase [Cyanobacteria bacterium UBA11166]HBR73764.1 hydrolase [Cyanobacteria bacterium UBA11159]HBS68797.1 hydrolase [Cyanobacteria bacterium UBA11153]HBW92245.1 hydrolase [Cyanobacteria bacterium UBA11149]
MSIIEQSISVGSLQWFYREAKPVNISDKPPVVLLHGLPSQSYCWTAIMPELAAQGFKSIAPDWIGFGYSAKPDRRDFAYTPDAFIKALAEFLKTLEIERFYLVVQGFLGSVGLQYALRYPDRIERLAILNTPISPAAIVPWKIQQLGLPFIGDMLTQDPLLVDRTLEGGSGYQISERDLDVYRKPYLKSSDPGRSLGWTVKNLELRQSMAEIDSGFRSWKTPTLIVWGIKDPWLPFVQVEEFIKITQNVELVKLEEAGHYPQDHWSEKIAESLAIFFRRFPREVGSAD